MTLHQFRDVLDRGARRGTNSRIWKASSPTGTLSRCMQHLRDVLVGAINGLASAGLVVYACPEAV
jgi:hypothetical protein